MADVTVRKTEARFPEPLSLVIDLTIPNFSSLKSHNTTILSDEICTVISTTNTSGSDRSATYGFGCRLEMYPLRKNTVAATERDFVAIYLNVKCFKNYDKERCEYANTVTNYVIPEFSRRAIRTFSTKENLGFGFPTFMAHCDIWGPNPCLLLEDDILKIRADVKLTELPSSKNTQSALLESLQVQNRLMYESELGKDFALISSDKVKHDVHRAVIGSASPVFRAMFETNMKESKSRRCVIADVDGVTMEALLKFAYYGCVENLKVIAKDVLVAADKYELLRLKERCDDVLAAEVNAENVAEMLLFADKMSATKLKQAAIQFLAADPDTTLSSSETNEIFDTAGSNLIKEVVAAMMKAPQAKRKQDQISS